MISKLKFKDSFFLIAGPCAIESEEIAFDIARHIKAICEKLEVPFVFKGSLVSVGLLNVFRDGQLLFLLL